MVTMPILKVRLVLNVTVDVHCAQGQVCKAAVNVKLTHRLILTNLTTNTSITRYATHHVQMVTTKNY